jgi:hypothetical protein
MPTRRSEAPADPPRRVLFCYRIKLGVANAVSSKFAAPFALLPFRDVFGTARVSTDGQTLDPQRAAFKAASERGQDRPALATSLLAPPATARRDPVAAPSCVSTQYGNVITANFIFEPLLATISDKATSASAAKPRPYPPLA